MKILATIWFSLIVAFGYCQCITYQAYESFGTTTLTQGGTWASNSITVSANAFRTGARSLTFNGSGDWVRTSQLTSPGVISFWYRRSTNSTAWTLIVETSPNNTTWTTRSTITNPTTTFQQHNLNLGTLGLTNIYVRLRDARASGAQERYVDDLSWTSTNSLNNSLVPFPVSGNCTQNVGMDYTIIDQGGPNESYNNSLDQYMVLQPDSPTKKVEITFSSINIETSYDSLIVYNGPTISSPRIGAYTGTVSPGTLTSTALGGELTLRFKSDVSNVGTWSGFVAMATTITPLPVELLYFEGTVYPSFNNLKWATASEYNSSHFIVEISIDGLNWIEIVNKPSAGNSIEKINYYYLDNIDQFVLHYYRLVQHDIDGQFEIYGPIVLNNTIKVKKVVKYVNLMGQEVGDDVKGVLFEVYEDGTSKKIIR